MKPRDNALAQRYEQTATTFNLWPGKTKYEDVAGFCMSASLDDIRGHGHVLTPGRYVGAEDIEDDGEPFEEKMRRLTAALEGQFTQSDELQDAIRQHLEGFADAVA